MQFLASGQAGIFAVQTANGYTVERLDIAEKFQANSRDIGYYFSGCNDVKQFIASDVTTARTATEIDWSADRALQLFCMLIDPDEHPADLVEVGEVLEELLAVPKVVAILEDQIYAAPLPRPVDAATLLKTIEPFPISLSAMKDFLDLQPFIFRVRSSFDKIESSHFESNSSRNLCLELAIDQGCFSALVRAASTDGGVDKALFKLYSELSKIDNYRAIIDQWTETFERAHYNVLPIAEPEFEESFSEEIAGVVSNRQAFERAMSQQQAIVSCIKSAEFDKARIFVRDLIADQQRTGSAEHLTKSLNNLSQKAKELDVDELALEWAQQAIEFKADDPIAHAQLAYLLMSVGRYAEAQQSLDFAETFGASGYAASGRARILRYQGQTELALAAYKDAKQYYSPTEERNHYNMAGIAECFRDMERFDEALTAYDAAIMEYPYEQVLHSGRAATLTDMGRFDEAREGYMSALHLDGSNVVPRNGIATLLRRSGNLKEAEREYRRTISEYPFNTPSRGGLVATLRDQGRYNDAVSEAELLVAKVPTSLDSYWSLADAQIDARLFEGAISTIKRAAELFSLNAGLQSGLARVEKTRGNYLEALNLFDQAIRAFPSNITVQIGRADMLRRLGNLQEALNVYMRILQRNPHRLAIASAIASIHIHEGRFDLAKRFLQVVNPITADEWRNFALKGMLAAAEDRKKEAEDLFERGIDLCPFDKEKQIFRASLSQIQIEADAPKEAIETLKECKDDLGKLLYFHANAKMGDIASGRDMYAQLKDSDLPEPYHEMREEIARQYNIIDLMPRRNAKWLLDREAKAILLEAA